LPQKGQCRNTGGNKFIMLVVSFSDSSTKEMELLQFFRGEPIVLAKDACELVTQVIKFALRSSC
jgi:hypothetical protein